MIRRFATLPLILALASTVVANPPTRRITLPPLPITRVSHHHQMAPPPVMDGCPGPGPCMGPELPCDRCHPPCEKTLRSTQVLLVPHERAVCKPELKLREVEVCRKPTGPVLGFREEQQCVTEMKLESREVEEQVVCEEKRPITVTDPCTGQCRTEYECYPVVKTVKVKVYEVVPNDRIVTIRVPILEPGPEVVVNKLVLDKTSTAVVERSFKALITDTKTKIVSPWPEVPMVPPICSHPKGPRGPGTSP